MRTQLELEESRDEELTRGKRPKCREDHKRKTRCTSQKPPNKTTRLEMAGVPKRAKGGMGRRGNSKGRENPATPSWVNSSPGMKTKNGPHRRLPAERTPHTRAQP